MIRHRIHAPNTFGSYYAQKLCQQNPLWSNSSKAEFCDLFFRKKSASFVILTLQFSSRETHVGQKSQLGLMAVVSTGRVLRHCTA